MLLIEFGSAYLLKKILRPAHFRPVLDEASLAHSSISWESVYASKKVSKCCMGHYGHCGHFYSCKI